MDQTESVGSAMMFKYCRSRGRPACLRLEQRKYGYVLWRWTCFEKWRMVISGKEKITSRFTCYLRFQRSYPYSLCPF